MSVHQGRWRAAAVLLAAGLLLCGSPAFAQTALDANAPIQLHPPTIQLHLPAKKPPSRRHKTAPDRPQMHASTRTPAKPVAAVLPGSPSHAERRKAVEEALVAPAAPASAQSNSTGFSFDAGPAPQPPPAARATSPKKESVRKQTNKPHLLSVPHKATGVASLEVPQNTVAAPADASAHPTDHTGLTKEGEVLFPHADADPQTDSIEQLKTLAAAVNSALDSGSGRVELEAYGGPPGDKSSEARRLSLRRALATRQLLIDSGVPANRIDVRALGGIDDHGNADRVDVFLSGNS